MSTQITNAKTFPKRYFGLHFAPGVAEYAEPQANGDSSFRILVEETVIKNMDKSYEGKPVYVNHVDNVNLDNIQNEVDGYVVKSFFNKADGKHWVEFIVVSDKGHEAIASGWKLSNAYIPKSYGPGGLWHGVEYSKEVMDAEYEHLAIVPNPRYEESIILNPDDFKAYNEKKVQELEKIANAKEGKKSMFNFFKKTKVENATDFDTMSVTLEKSGVEKTITTLINEADAMEMFKKEEQPMANSDHYVMVGEEKMKLNELVEKYCSMKSSMDKPKEEPKKEEIKEKVEDKKEKNMGDEEALKTDLELAEHELEEIKEKKTNSGDEHFKKLVNAEFSEKTASVIELSSDLVSRGKQRYGSN